MKLRIFLLLILTHPVWLGAQGLERKAAVKVDVEGTTNGTNYQVYVQDENMPSQPVPLVDEPGNGTGIISQALNLKPGKIYNFWIDSSSTDIPPAGEGSFDVTFKTPEGYTMYVASGVNTMPTVRQPTLSGTGYPLAETGNQYYYSFQLVPDSVLTPSVAGQMTRLDVGDLVFELGLGTLKNGKSAGRLQLRHDGRTSGGGYGFSTGSPGVFDLNSLVLVSPLATEVGWTTITGGRQLETGQVKVETVSAGANAYTIKFYARDSLGNYGANEYASYTLEQATSGLPANAPANADCLKITEVQGSTTVVHWVFRSTVSDAWTLIQGTGAELRIEEHASTAAGSDRVETITIKDSGLSVVAKRRLTWTDLNNAEVLTQDEAWSDPTGSVDQVTTYTYYGTSSGVGQGDRNMLYSITYPNGLSTTYNYYDDTARLGQVETVTEQWSTPGGPVTKTTTYDYDGPASGGYKDYLKSRVVTIGATEVSRLENDYGSTLGTAEVSFTTRNYYSTGSHLDTITVAHPRDADYYVSERPLSIKYPDGRQQSFVYQRGTLSGTSFTESGTGTATRTIIIEGSHTAGGSHASATIGGFSASFKSIGLLDKKSTATVILRNATDNVVQESVYVWSGGSFGSANLVAQTTNSWHDSVRQASAVALNGATQSWTWENVYLKTQTDAAGITTTYGYDSVGRLRTSLRAGVTGTYTYYPTNQRSSLEETGGALSRATDYFYDGLGRPTYTALPDGRSMSATYTLNSPSTGWLTIDETLSCGGHVITVKMPDGKIRSIDSPGVDEFHSYTILSNGGIATRVRYGSDNDTRYVETERDRLGRVVKVTRPGLPGMGTTVTETYVYSGTTGLLTKIERTGFADEYRDYDGMGRLTRTGVDLGGGGLSPLDNLDRITDIITEFAWVNSQWWASTERKTYPYDNGTALSLGIVRQQLTGLTGGAGKTEEVDRFGQVRTTSVSVNAGTVTTTQQIPGVNNVVTTITVNGRLHQTTDASGRSVTYGYDGLGRRNTATDSRNGTTTYSYYVINGNDTDRLHWVQDPSEVYVSIFDYDAGGRVDEVTTPTGTTYYKYDCAGRLKAQWGAATPAAFGYTIYGERETMRTFRLGDYSSTEPPSTGGDLTIWTYDPASGVLIQKKDAENNATDYTYNSRGLVETIIQARYASGTSGPRATTTFSYLPLSTEVTGQTFNDSGVTSSLGYSYYRSGLVKDITDATGTRTFVYDANLQLETETLDASFYGGRKLVRQYDAQHRPVGFTLKTGADVVELQQTHAYNGTTGLLDSVSAQQGTGSPRAFGYNYLSGTALLDTISTGTGGSLFAVSRTYETISSVTKRDLVSSIQATYGAGAPITAFDYTYRGDRRRATARQSGTAYADYGDGSAGSESTYYRYQYNFRGELTGATGYLGTDVNATTTPLSGRFFAYGYDGAGNRTTSNPTGDNETMVNGDKLYETGYQVDGLNQIWQKQNPYLPVSGTVQSAASGVAVNGFAAGKQGGHWSGEAFLANDNVPAAGLITVNAIKAGPPDTGESAGVLGVIGPDPEVLDYDQDGNLTEDGLWDYVYNQRNQLIHLETKLPSGSAAPRWRLEFEYDYLGRRVQKQVTDLSTSAVTTRRYVYDGWNLVGEYAVSGGTIGALTRSYAWGLDVAGSLSATGGVGALVQLSVHESTTVTDFYPTYDGHGNVTALVKSNGTLAAVYEYGPFGEALRVEEPDPLVAGNPFRFSTKFSDVETGLIYYGHRYYSAALGRFINRDPIGEAGGLNLYAFVGNDPVNSVDVLGLDDEAPNLTDCIWVKENGDWVLKCPGREGGSNNDNVERMPPYVVNEKSWRNYTAPSIVINAPYIVLTFGVYGPGGPGGPSGPGDDPTDDDSSDPKKLGDAFRNKQEHCQKLGDHIANLKQSIRAGIQDLRELGGQFQTATLLNQAQLVGTLVGGAGGVAAGVRHASMSAWNSVLSGWIRAAGSPIPRSMIPAGVREYAAASAGFASATAVRGAPTGLVLNYAYYETVTNELPPIGVVLAPGGAAAEAIVSMTDMAASWVMSAIQNQQSMLEKSMAEYEKDCK